MQRNNGARLLPLLIVIIVVALLIAAVISIGRAVFNQSGSSTTETSQLEAGRESLLKTDVNRSVSMTVRGPIVADETFKSYQITASPNQRTMDIYTGYLDERTGGKTLGNNARAYEQFVFALDKANMMKGDEPTDDADNDLRGICATGYVYEYAVLNDDNVVKRLWTSTCGGSSGSLDASTQQLTNLFLAQIPNSDDLIPFRSTTSSLSF